MSITSDLDFYSPSVFHRFDWIRDKFLPGEHHPLHTLRKEYGSLIAQHAGIPAAADLLGHRDIPPPASITSFAKPGLSWGFRFHKSRLPVQTRPLPDNKCTETAAPGQTVRENTTRDSVPCAAPGSKPFAFRIIGDRGRIAFARGVDEFVGVTAQPAPAPAVTSPRTTEAAALEILPAGVDANDASV